MPGVPSGRGCDECRRVKKKCDLQAQSVSDGLRCSRCARLEIACVGAGVRRFKFVDSGHNVASNTPLSLSRAASRSVTPMVSQRLASPSALSRVSSDDLSLLAGSFKLAIDSSVDERFNLLSTYGPFVNHIPSRLGRNKGLDAAVGALVAAHAGVCLGLRHPSAAILSKYTVALTEVRLALDDPVAATSTESLCAVMLLCICQSFLGGGECVAGISHTVGMARILKHRSQLVLDSSDELEQLLIMTVRGPVVFETLWQVNPRAVLLIPVLMYPTRHDVVDFTEEQWYELVAKQQVQSDFAGSRIMPLMARVPIYIRRGQRWRHGEQEEPDLAADVTSCFEELLHIRSVVQGTIGAVHTRFTNGEISYATYSQVNFDFLRIQGLANSTVCIVGTILSELVPNYSGLQRELFDCAVEILELSERMSRWRPLGASIMALALCSAYMATKDVEQRRDLLHQIRDYLSDFPTLYPGDQLLRSLRQIEQRIRLRDLAED